MRAVLVEVVWNISRMKNNYLSAKSHRLARRLGKLKAAIAVAHSLLVIIYHVLRDKERLTRQALRRLEALGYAVTLTPKQEEVI